MSSEQKKFQATEGHPEKKKFEVPSRDQLIQQIKELDEEIEHVSLNLIKCDFNATEKDVKKAFPDVEFVKVKNYNPGSFEVVFEMKIDAIHFIKNCYDKKILNRRFFIKMGRQHKEVVEDWSCVGYVPRDFVAQKKPHHNNREHNRPQRNQREKKEEQSEQPEHPEESEKKQKVERKGSATMTGSEINIEIKQNEQLQTKVSEEEKKHFKVIPKPDYKKNKTGYHGNKSGFQKNDPKEQKSEGQKGAQTPTAEQKEEPKNKETPNVEIKQRKEPSKKPEKPAQETEEDDGWIQVPTKPKNNRKR